MRFFLRVVGAKLAWRRYEPGCETNPIFRMQGLRGSSNRFLKGLPRNGFANAREAALHAP
ncbi:hypothetical protein CHELA20_11479 [Hyphomicrobiales bacterium]|nr:hypothetical protein CHELA20_11479 [Hyphomicrobiales bacterium]CAH1695899.1 hypothetical protein CHELA41_51725 [Hyphomicrobiales bacterium]